MKLQQTILKLYAVQACHPMFAKGSSLKIL
jgi:hypothetical protein